MPHKMQHDFQPAEALPNRAFVLTLKKILMRLLQIKPHI